MFGIVIVIVFMWLMLSLLLVVLLSGRIVAHVSNVRINDYTSALRGSLSPSFGARFTLMAMLQ